MRPLTTLPKQNILQKLYLVKFTRDRWLGTTETVTEQNYSEQLAVEWHYLIFFSSSSLNRLSFASPSSSLLPHFVVTSSFSLLPLFSLIIIIISSFSTFFSFFYTRSLFFCLTFLVIPLLSSHVFFTFASTQNLPLVFLPQHFYSRFLATNFPSFSSSFLSSIFSSSLTLHIFVPIEFILFFFATPSYSSCYF